MRSHVVLFSKTLGDKILGLKEQIAGKLTQNPERLSRGRDILSGEERRKKLTGEVCILFYFIVHLEIIKKLYYQNEPNPFEQAGEDDSAKNEEKPTGVPDTSLSTSVASDRGTTETEEEQGRPKIVDTNHDQT